MKVPVKFKFENRDRFCFCVWFQLDAPSRQKSRADADGIGWRGVPSGALRAGIEKTTEWTKVREAMVSF